jgi:mono/diheme cytochrome c family protein
VPLRGGRRFDAPALGVIYSKNLTPDSETGIGRYTDAQIARMMRRSVRPDGRAAPQALMPFHNMSDEDLVAVLSFLRAQRPARHIVRPNEFTVLGKIVKSVTEGYKPRRAEEVHPPPASPPEAPTRERGEYLARHVADCAGCHTPRHRITFRQAGPEFSGNPMAGATLPGADPAVRYAAPDITPARGSALTKYRHRASFVARFKAGTRHPPGSPMPWEAYSLMSEADLGGLYEFLRSLPAADGPAGDFNRRAAN